jgi:diguanylate cyclase (GGDEF)-like protein
MADRTRLLDPHRLAVLHDLAIMDTPAEPAYDDIAQLASACCDSEIAAVNFVDDHRHWTKAISGVKGGRGASVPSEVSFCAETVASSGGVLCISDTHGDQRWRSHPLVLEGPKVRFYAGASIVVAGEPIGVVCVFGDEPRALGEREEQALKALARQASAQLELRNRNTELRKLAVTDPLTGLANRTLLDDHLELAIAQRARDGGHIGVLFCDLDGFKAVNDLQGHEAGDRVLCEVAECLHQATRAADTVARIGGDEFVVVCPGLEAPEALDVVVSRINAALHAPRAEDAEPLPRLSIGATLLGDEETAASVLVRADAAMYADKILLPAVLARD